MSFPFIAITTFLLFSCQAETEATISSGQELNPAANSSLSFEPKVVHSIQLNTRVIKADFSADGSKIITMIYDGDPHAFDVQTGEQLSILPPDAESILDVAFHPSDSLLGISYTSGDACLWDYKNGKKLFTWRDEAEYREDDYREGPCLDFDLNGKYFAFPGSQGQKIRVVSVQTGEDLVAIDVPQILSLGLHPDAGYVIASTGDGSLVFSTKTGEQILHLDAGEGHSFVKWHPDGKTISVTGITGGATRSWAFPSGEKYEDLDQFGTAADYNPIAFSENGNLIWAVDAYEDIHAVLCFNTSTRELVMNLSHDDENPCWLFSPVGQRKIYAISYSGLLMVWEF